ncbi:MAG: hypothetical protein Q9O74_04710 [Planctomycetota bacterium]|nr:hypothetical protein [Planctomycetota bacterium]
MAEGETKILLVGHCRPDAFAMRAALGRYAPGAAFVEVNDTEALRAHPDAAALLVNRVLDGQFGTGNGVELIGMLSDGLRGRTALVSNLPDAQAEAVAAGAVEGFGKSEMYSERARATIEGLVGVKADG